jgi:hypothetical protein
MKIKTPPKGGRPKEKATPSQPLLDRRLAKNVKLALARKRLSQAELAAYLDWNPSSLVRAFENPHRLQPKLDAIADFLEVVPGSLMDPSPRDLDAAKPAGAPVASEGQPAESLVSRVFPALDDNGLLICSPGMAIWHLMASPENRLRTESITLLLAAPKIAPLAGELVFAQTKDGKRWLRLFGRDHRDNSLIILSPYMPGDSPVVSPEAELEDLRVVTGTIRLGGMP